MLRITIRVAAALVAALALSGTAQAQTVKKIKDTKSVAIAYRTDALPFSFVDNNQPIGYTVDICKRVVASLEQQFGAGSLSIKWVPATTQNRMELVAKHEADMECGSTTMTLGRMEQVDFSNMVFVDGGGMVVRDDANIKTMGDLGGKKIAVIGGTTTETALRAALKKRLINAQIVLVKSREEGLQAAESGTADAFATDRVLLVGLARKAKDPSKMTMLGEDFSFEPYAIVLPRGDWEFRLAVNRALAQLYRSGDIEEIFNKYFAGLGQPSVLLSAMYYLNAIPE